MKIVNLRNSFETGSVSHFQSTTSDSLQTRVRDNSRYRNTVKVSHSSCVRLEREETEQGDEVTLNEVFKVGEDATRGGMGWLIYQRENTNTYGMTSLVDRVGAEEVEATLLRIWERSSIEAEAKVAATGGLYDIDGSLD